MVRPSDFGGVWTGQTGTQNARGLPRTGSNDERTSAVATLPHFPRRPSDRPHVTVAEWPHFGHLHFMLCLRGLRVGLLRSGGSDEFLHLFL